MQAFEKATGRKVNIQIAPEEYDTKMRTLLAGGIPPEVMRVNDDYVRGFSVAGQFLDLTPFIQTSNLNPDDYYEPVFNFPKQPDGKHTAWSLGNQPRLIYYNVNMFNEAGVPLPPTTWTDEGWKWDDFVERAKALTAEGERWGALVYDDTGYEQTFSVNNGNADGIWSADGKRFALSEPQGVEAVQWATDLTCVHRVQPERSLITQRGAANQMFAAGRLGMIFRTFGTTPYFRTNVKDFEWDVAPPPGKVQQKTEGSLIVFCVPKAVKDPAGAWELLSFLSGPEGGKIFADGGQFVPVLKQAAETIAPGDAPPKHIQLFAEAMNYQTTTNFTENTERARQIYRPELDRVYICEATAAEVLNQVKQEVEDALENKF